MTITRKIFGIIPIKIALTEQEIYSAYAEEQHAYDVADIQSKIEDRWEEDDIPEKLKNPEFISKIADKFRRYMDNNDYISELLWDTADYAIDNTLKEEE